MQFRRRLLPKSDSSDLLVTMLSAGYCIKGEVIHRAVIGILQAVELSSERTLKNWQLLQVHASFFPTVSRFMPATLSKQALCHSLLSRSTKKLFFGVGNNFLLSPGT